MKNIILLDKVPLSVGISPFIFENEKLTIESQSNILNDIQKYLQISEKTIVENIEIKFTKDTAWYMMYNVQSESEVNELASEICPIHEDIRGPALILKYKIVSPGNYEHDDADVNFVNEFLQEKRSEVIKTVTISPNGCIEEKSILKTKLLEENKRCFLTTMYGLDIGLIYDPDEDSEINIEASSFLLNSVSVHGNCIVIIRDKYSNYNPMSEILYNELKRLVLHYKLDPQKYTTSKDPLAYIDSLVNDAKLGKL